MLTARRHVIAFCAAALTLTPDLHAQTPGVYAIRGARIVTAAGAPIESGTVVIRRGAIEAVGASIAAPADAEVIDGSGLTVYPGLIDLGNTRVALQPVAQPPQSARTTAELERWKKTQVLRPQARAADQIKVDEVDLTRLAAAGITSVLALPAGDVISGQSALINVVAPPEPSRAGDPAMARNGLMIVKTPVALHVSFPGRPRAGTAAYPSSLMGVMAFVRQAFLDAQHYGVEQAHDRRARAGERTPDELAFEAMQPAIAGTLPVAFEANEPREILRALSMARELKLDPIVTGARGAGELAADLQSGHARVIYSLNYPQRSRALAPDADEPIRALVERAGAPGVPAALAEAGVAFAFASAGLNDPKDFVKNAARAVRAGLAPDAAIRALTVNAARIAGADDRIGTIEAGKIANLVVTDGDLFGEGTKVVRVFVDGRAVALEAAPARPRRGRGTRF